MPYADMHPNYKKVFWNTSKYVLFTTGCKIKNDKKSFFLSDVLKQSLKDKLNTVIGIWIRNN